MSNYFTIIVYRTHNITRLHLFLKDMISLEKSESNDGDFIPNFQ